MPATVQKSDNENSFYHIYNQGRDSRVIFNDNNDYSTFIGYLNEYLTPRPDPATTKRVFTVQGKTYHGIPHQPKNYHGKIELVAYSLVPTSFNFLLKQYKKGLIESFIRSLCTRYSIYFNKKYKRTGSLFEGPYKSIYIEDESSLPLLTYYLHKLGQKSSIDKYLDTSPPEWALGRPNINNYKDFIEKYEPDQSQKELLKIITFAGKTRLIEKTILSDNGDDTIQIDQRKPEIIFAGILLLLLFTFGLQNVTSHTGKIIKSTPDVSSAHKVIDSGQVSGLSTENVVPENTEIKTIIIVKLDDGLLSTSIYKDIYKSEELIRVDNGTELELISKSEDWSEVKLLEGINGFIETQYTEILETNNQ